MNSDVAMIVGVDSSHSHPAVVYLNPEDKLLLGTLYLLVQAPRNHYTLVIAMDSDEVPNGYLKLSKTSRENVQVEALDKVKVSIVADAVIAKSISMSPVADTLCTRNWMADFLKDYFETHTYPYPVHVDDILHIENKNGELIDFVITEIDCKRNGYALLEKDTSIHIGDHKTKAEVKEMKRRVGFADLGGVDHALEQVRMMVEAPLKFPDLFDAIKVEPPRGILLYGPSGTGKTNIARAIAAEIGAYFHVINGPEVLGKLAGESEKNLRDAFNECKKQAPSILFFDEIDAIAPKRDKSQGDLEKRLVSQLLTLMDGMNSRSGISILAATNRPNSLDPALRRFGRFDKEIEVGVPDQKGRLKILQIKTRRVHGILENVDLEELASDCHGYVGADLEALVEEAGQTCVLRTWKEIRKPEVERNPDQRKEIIQNARITADDFKMVMEKMVPSALRETVVETPKVEWESIGGLAEVKKNIQQMIQFPIQNARDYEKFAVSPSRGVLFFGPPGCGKTLIAKAAARMCNVNFISVKGPELLTMWLGESEANVRQLFDRARSSAPCILFFDEMDSIASKRESGESGGAPERVLNQMLTELDGIGEKKNVFIIAATNRPDCIDPAVLRPGRLDQLIYIPLPDKQGRLQILQANVGIDPVNGDCSKSKIESDVDLDFLAEFTDGYSGADLAEICSRAVKCAINDIVEKRKTEPEYGKSDEFQPKLTMEHFEEAMEYARRSVSDDDVLKFNVFVDSLCKKGQKSGFKFPRRERTPPAIIHPIIASENEELSSSEAVIDGRHDDEDWESEYN